MVIPRHFPVMLSIVLHRLLSSDREFTLEPSAFRNADDVLEYLAQVVPKHALINGVAVNSWSVLFSETRLGFYIQLGQTYLMVWIENGLFNVTIETGTASGKLSDNTLHLKVQVDQNGRVMLREMYPTSTQEHDEFLSFVMEALHHFFETTDGKYAAIVVGEEFDKETYAKASGFGQFA